MDVSYLMYALTAAKDNPKLAMGYVEALEWIMQYVDDHWDHFDDLLDIEREARK